MSVNNYLSKMLVSSQLNEAGASEGLSGLFSGSAWKDLGRLGMGIAKIVSAPAKAIDNILFNKATNSKDLVDIDTNLSKMTPGTPEFNAIMQKIYQRLLQYKYKKPSGGEKMMVTEKDKKYFNDLNEIYEKHLEREVDKLKEDMDNAKTTKDMNKAKDFLRGIIKIIIDRDSSLIKKINSITMETVDKGNITPDTIKKLKDLDANLSKLSIIEEPYMVTMGNIMDALKKAKNKKYFDALNDIYEKHLDRELDDISTVMHEAKDKAELEVLFNRLTDILKHRVADKNSDITKTITRLMARIKDEEKQIIDRNREDGGHRWSAGTKGGKISKEEANAIEKKKDKDVSASEAKSMIEYLGAEFNELQAKIMRGGKADYEAADKMKDISNKITHYNKLLGRK
jgi:hypothetical protein